MFRLTKHFIQNWRKRVGTDPAVGEVNTIINQAVRIQKGRKVPGRFKVFKVLSIYWHANQALIITVDPFSRSVVSVYSQANMPRDLRTVRGREARIWGTRSNF